MDTGGNDVVPCTFGGGPTKDGSLDLEELLGFQVLPHEVEDLGPELHGVKHLGPSEVEIPVLHPDVLVGEDVLLLVSELEGRECGLVEQLGGTDSDLDVTGRITLILGSLDPLPDDSVDHDDGFPGECPEDLLDGIDSALGRFGVEDDLCNSVSVGKVDEGHSSVVP